MARRLKAPTLSLAAHEQARAQQERQAEKARQDVAAALANARGPANATVAGAAAGVAGVGGAEIGGRGGKGWGRWLKWW